jgi:phage tail sheath gpL-like
MAIAFGFSVPNEPGVYVEVDGSASGVTGKQKSRVLVLGQRRSTGTVAKDTLTLVPSTASGRTYFGRGSFIANTITVLKAAYPGAEVWAIAQDDDGAGVAASGTLTVTASGALSGTIYLYIAGKLVTVGVTAGDAQNDIATAIAAAINADGDLPVTATALTNAVTVTCRHKGVLGNKIDLRLNYYGEAGGEVLPSGVSIAVVSMASGTTEPDLDNTIAAMTDQAFDTIVCPYSIAAQLIDLKAELASRWSATRMVYGHVCGAVSSSFADLITFGTSTAQNDPHVTVIGYTGSPTPPWEVSASLGALTAEHQMDADESTLAQGFTSLPLYGMKPPTAGSEFTVSERDSLLSYGIATYTVNGGSCYLSRARTTYRTDSSGSPDGAFYDQRTLAILQRIIRSDRAAFLRDFAGAVLVDDATRVGGGLKVCSPAVARGWFSARYARYEAQGLVTDADGFLNDLVIEIHDGDPNRLDILYPPQITGWLATAAMKLQFRLV